MTINLDYMVAIGMGIKTATYFRLIYPIYTGVNDYGILHIAIFGTN